MDVPLESERHPESPILAKSPIAQDRADFWLAINLQEELIQKANEEAFKHFKINQRLLSEYRSTYNTDYPSLCEPRANPESYY